jgi:hypothetical protein
MGTDPPKLQFVDGSHVKATDTSRVSRQTAIRNVLPDLLPLAPGSIDERLMNEYPRFGFGVGASSFSPDYGGLQSAYNQVEDTYKEQGYTIQHHEPNFGSSALLWLDFKTEISSSFALHLEAGTQLSGQVNFKAVSLSLSYTMRELLPGYFYPYVGVGIGRYRISIEQHYGESIGNGATLDALLIDAAKMGFNFTAGIETGTNMIWNLYAGYLYVPILKQTVSGIDAKLNISSVILGARVTFFF